MRDIWIVFPDYKLFWLNQTKNVEIVEYRKLETKVLLGTWLKFDDHSIEVQNPNEALKIWFDILKAAERGDKVFRITGK